MIDESFSFKVLISKALFSSHFTRVRSLINGWPFGSQKQHLLVILEHDDQEVDIDIVNMRDIDASLALYFIIFLTLYTTTWSLEDF